MYPSTPLLFGALYALTIFWGINTSCALRVFKLVPALHEIEVEQEELLIETWLCLMSSGCRYAQVLASKMTATLVALMGEDGLLRRALTQLSAHQAVMLVRMKVGNRSARRAWDREFFGQRPQRATRRHDLPPRRIRSRVAPRIVSNWPYGPQTHRTRPHRPAMVRR